MEEILQKLLQSELLSEETRTQIAEQWAGAVETFKTQVREEVEGEVRLQLSEEFVKQRDELVEQVDSLVTEVLTRELDELRTDVAEHKDLKVVMAEQLVEEKHRLAEAVATELEGLVEKLDEFLDERLTAELSELQEEIELVKQDNFGRQIYEAFAQTFAQAHNDEDSITAKLEEAKAELRAVKRELSESEESRSTIQREIKLEKLLSSLSGKKREQMEMVLNGVPTARLEESYKYFIGRVLKEEAPTEPLTEGTVSKTTTVVTGNTPVETVSPGSDYLARMRHLAGVK